MGTPQGSLIPEARLLLAYRYRPTSGGWWLTELYVFAWRPGMRPLVLNRKRSPRMWN